MVFDCHPFVSVVASTSLAGSSPRTLTVQSTEGGETVQIVATDAQGNIVTGGKLYQTNPW